MKLYEFVERLQCFAWEGNADLEVEFTDNDGKTFKVPEKMELAKDHQQKIVEIKLHDK